MNVLHRIVFVPCALFLGAASGCSSATSDVPEEGNESALSSSCGATGQDWYRSYVFDRHSHPIAGARVCAAPVAGGEPACATTGSDGYADVRFDRCTDVRVTYEAAGFVPANRLVQSAQIESTTTLLLTPAELAQHARELGTTVDPAKGVVWVRALDREYRAAGKVTVTHVPASGTTFYLDLLARASPSQRWTNWFQAVGGVLNVDPGLVDIQGMARGAPCMYRSMPSGTTPNSVRAEVIPGSVAQLTVVCDTH